MKAATQAPEPPLEFPARGTRRRPGFGLTYRSKCGRYALYQSDLVDGLPVKPVRWKAMTQTRVLKQCRTRGGAIAACQRHAKGTNP